MHSPPLGARTYMKEPNCGVSEEIPDLPFPELVIPAGGKSVLYTSETSPMQNGKVMGRELFYRNGDSFMAVAVQTEPTFKLGKANTLFRRALLVVPS